MKRMFGLVLILVFSFVLTGCGGKGGSTSGPSDNGGDNGTGGGTTIGSAVARDAQAGGNFLDVANFPETQVVTGCDGLDCIPALTDPSSVGAGDSGASYLVDSDIVLGVVINGEAKAYPHNIGWWHEIVND